MGSGTELAQFLRIFLPTLGIRPVFFSNVDTEVTGHSTLPFDHILEQT